MNEKMKTLKLILIFTLMAGTIVAQDVQSKLDDAKIAYNDGDREAARFALEQSLAELDKIVGEEILKVLPDGLSGIPANKESDNVTGGMGYTGVYVDRAYDKEPQFINIQVITDSPFLAMVNSVLTNPMMAALSGDDQKVIKLSGYKALLEIQEGEDAEDYKISLPVSNSLISIETQGFTEDEALDIANQLDIKSIVALIGTGQ